VRRCPADCFSEPANLVQADAVNASIPPFRPLPSPAARLPSCPPARLPGCSGHERQRPARDMSQLDDFEVIGERQPVMAALTGQYRELNQDRNEGNHRGRAGTANDPVL
jgi:hypothetical protein